MSHANTIGRVGALAVTLGVGWAIATAAPGVAYADDTGADTAAAAPGPSQTATAASRGAERRAAAQQRRQDARDAAATRRAERQEARKARAAERASDTDTDGPDRASVTITSNSRDAESSRADAPADPPPAAPLALTTLLTAAAGKREERTAQRTTAVPQVSALAADDTPNVLVIGIDGTNLSKILANPANANLFGLMQGGTTAASTIVGHTTISNPSWSSILTGAWGENTGVINNVFTPWTYSTWPTLFTQLEQFNSSIETTAISDWDVIAGIAGTGGTATVDNNIYFDQVAGDTDWSKTDDRVGDATEAAILGADPNVGNFVFSYFVGVDENGHMHGGDSPEYAAAITNVDRNIGEILDAIQASGQDWTIIVVTDHGHQPQKGIGHGFQSPPETSTFVIANGAGFDSGAINLTYSIVDVTPTVLTLFGGTPSASSDGTSLTDQDVSNVYPVDDDGALRAGLLDIIAKYGYPDAATEARLDLRTIVTSVPYFVFGATNQLTAGLQDLVDAGIPLVSLVAKIAIIPVQLGGDLLYVATNLAAQIVAKLTGVEGARIFPLWPPAPPAIEPQPDETTTLVDLFAVCGDDPASASFLRCGAPSIAV
ncbi:sulfatase-like hydrolase/transferase [Mycolicibacterium sp. 018/SC-01/001]|uniref:alkaline phosphatase family protein n=1 Tax=Mycolicibacterium sp. 018/SC-01/001 TaxID=2592069 RepID=UPI0011812AA8|nr:alkaline phosphatase family protein [Mycolicibacterium sp. 018/SC-01/001]TRW79453.1 sulfatase-like hydrolase/transferase [Mycolicibacterium sp. 018/SC-01/001]